MIHRLVIVLALASSAAAQPPPRARVLAQVDSLAREFVAVTRTPGISVAVVQGQDTIVMKGYGAADLVAHIAAGPKTVYRIGSMSKQFTAAEIMRQVERGKISLDDDVSKFLPDVPLHGNRVTIRQLLNHTSGIPDYGASSAWRNSWTREVTPRQIVALVENSPFDFAPGTRWRYSNTGYTLLGMVLEKVTGEAYASLLQRELFTPLGLTQTSYCPTTANDSLYATGYAVANGGVAPAPFLSMSQFFSSGALCSTVGDLVRWQRALAGGKVVSAQSYELMTTPDTLNDGSRLTYGFGLGPGELKGHAGVAHGGGLAGFTTFGIFFPADTLNVVVFSNASSGPDPLALNIARTALGIPPPGTASVGLSAADRDLLVGVYELARPHGSNLVVHVAIENGQLMARPEGADQEEFALIPLGDLEFSAGFDSSLRIAFDRKGAVTLFESGVVMKGKKR